MKYCFKYSAVFFYLGVLQAVGYCWSEHTDTLICALTLDSCVSVCANSKCNLYINRPQQE